MFKYSLIQWFLFFYIYCFLGWIIESTIVSVCEKRLVNRGYLKGPFLPIYGSGAVIVLLTTINLKDNIIALFVCGMTSATILEYLTSWLMDITIKIKYWDYSYAKYNVNGRICLTSSLFWGFLSVALTRYIHEPISNFVTGLDNIYFPFTVITIYLIFDFAYSTYNVVNLNKLLSILTTIKYQIDEIHLQIKDYKLSSSGFDMNYLNEKLSDLKKDYYNLKSKFNFFHFQIIKAYPKAKSKKFNEAFKDLKYDIKNKLVFKYRKK